MPDQRIYTQAEIDAMSPEERSGFTTVTPEEAAELERAKEELGELIDLHEKLIEMRTPVPYKPNRKDRRAMAKQDKKKGRGKRR